MSEYKIIDKDKWHRKDHFNFYRKFDNACFNLCVPINAEKIYEFSQDKNESFFQLVLYAILRSVNLVPQMKQRLLHEYIIEYSTINVMTPIKTQQDGFRQIMCEYTDNYAEFSKQVYVKIENLKNSDAGPMIVKNDAFFCASCLPWVHFSSITHAELNFSASVPTLTWGMLKNGVIPVSCKFNHMFVDGLHASHFFALIEKYFDRPEEIILK